MYEAWFDGICEPVNPNGHAAYGCVIKRHGKVVFRDKQYVGHGKGMSNNVAEYAGVISVLKHLSTLPEIENEPVIIRGDSRLVVNQMAGKWAARAGGYIPYFKQALALARGLKAQIQYEWIPREQNAECDDLSRDILRAKGIRFAIHRERVA